MTNETSRIKPTKAEFWRRRATVAVLATLALAGVKAGYDHISSPGPRAIDLSKPHNEYTAVSGDTLAGIIERAEPGKDPNALVDSIELTIAARDHLKYVQDAENIEPGEVIPLPDKAHLGTEVPGAPGTP